MISEEDGRELFTCFQCGCHDLHVVQTYQLTRYFINTVSCDCGESPSGNAVTVEKRSTHDYRAVYELDGGHRFKELVDDVEELDEIEDDEEDDQEVECESCFEEAYPNDWHSELDPTAEAETENDEFYVQCAECDREIEFGWSHPDRGGRIWPAECTDFNPWKCWPEPRYVKSWLAKNWIRPGTVVMEGSAAK